jgi:lipopolysaccharide transport system ATP-binding protein
VTETAISARGLGKRYSINEQRHPGSLYESAANALLSPFRRRAPSSRSDYRLPTEIWALREVGFEVQVGEVLGVIGRNGSGKSTLLRMLARITTPSEGHATLNGRVGALLEVGTGFHPDLSGRDNILLAGTMIGMTPAEVRQRQDEIIAFSGVESFIDTPVKHYSSGMFMRLAFSVTAHLEAEILLIDEVLAVGDAAFQKKCKEKIRERARAGRTVLFTSHDMDAVRALCSSGLVLDRGRMLHLGDVDTAVREYERLSGEPSRQS